MMDRFRPAGHATGLRLRNATAYASVSACFLVCLSSPSRSTAGQNEPWPALDGPNSYSFASNRLSFPAVALVAKPFGRAALSHVFQVSPPYKITNLKILFANFYVDATGAANPERCPGNPKTVDFATVFVGDKAYPVSFAGKTSTTLGDCSYVWSDPVVDRSNRPIVLPAGTTYFIRSSQSVEIGEKMTAGEGYQSVKPRFSNATLGDGVEYSAEPQLDKRLGGTVAAFAHGSESIAPAMAIGTGWSGAPVFLIVGDSIAAGQSDADYAARSRGVVGYVARALDDDLQSSRSNFANLAAPGTRPADQSSTAVGQYRLRMEALRAIPNRPFNRILSEMGQNGLKSFPLFKGDMMRWWDFWHQTCPTCPIYQTTFLPHARAGANSLWTTSADQLAGGSVEQYPNGIRWQVNAWLQTQSSLPPYVKTLPITGAFTEKDAPSLWRLLDGAWTLSDAVPSQANRMVLSGAKAPLAGDWCAIEPSTPNAEVLQIYRTSGDGPWTVFLTAAAAKSHAADAPVRAAATGDGTHPGTALHKAAAAILVQMKSQGVLR